MKKKSQVWLAARSVLLGLAMVAGGAACSGSDQAGREDISQSSVSLDAATADARCEALAGTVVEGGNVVSAHSVSAGEALVDGTMAGTTVSVDICRAHLRLQPVPGSDIEVDVWMPEKWNQNLMGYGGAGFDGGLNPGAAPLFNNTVERGFAMVANDSGHKSGSSIESWVHRQPEKVIDFGHRANHLAAVAAQQVLGDYYGNPADHNYFVGCSAGGRDGLMLASRYPEDYDAIIAGAPARRYPAILTQLHWYTDTVFGEGGAPDLQTKMGLVHEAVLEKCDALDGVTDGVLEDPRICGFDPVELQCEGADAATCLTDAEIRALHRIYSGPRLSDGVQVISGPAISSEGAPDWAGWVTTTQGSVFGQEFYRWMVYDDPDWTIENFDLDRDYPVARERTAHILNVEDPDLSAFTGRGGRLIIYQGWNDPAIPAIETIDYYEQVLQHIGSDEADQVRLFMVPGMGHCAGGPGATSFDMQSVLLRWVEHGEAPERVVAMKPDNGEDPLTRPLCAWPKTARYVGSGSTRDAANFECKVPD